MNCQEHQEQISQFLDNELPQDALQPMFQHLAACGACREFFFTAKSIHDTARQLEYTPVPELLDQKLGVLDMTSRPLLERRFIISIPTAMLSMIAVFLFGAAVLLSFDSLSSEQQTQQSQMISQFPLPNTLQYSRN
ncbi:MAG: zf-HC2 domain-containing protein [Bacteroidota bacterium]